MTSVRLALLLVAGLLLLAPSAGAASARGELEAGALQLAEDATVESAGFSALSRADAPPELVLDLTGVSIQRIGQGSVEAGGLVDYDSAAIDESASFDRARITLATGAGEQVVALRAEGTSLATAPAAAVRGVGGAVLAAAVGDYASCASSWGGTQAADYCLDVLGEYEFTSDGIRATLNGPFSLILYGPVLEVDDDGQRTSYASGRVTTQGNGLAGQTEDAWIVLRAEGGAGTLSGPALKLYSPAPAIRASSIRFDAAEGAVRVGAMEYRAAGEQVLAEGAVLLTPGPVPPADDNGIAGETIYAASFPTRIQGDVTSISLRGAPAFLDTTAEKVGAAALLAAALAGIAYAWNHLAFGAAALYTRLNKPDILENDVRSRIYDIIRDNPGISAREVHRRSDQSWGTVVYHLRQLERHHLVVSRALGRTRNYYENHGKYRGMEVQLACLQSERALKLARAIAQQPGITQEQLAEASGLPQPTTSYYVRKLKQAGLVEEQREGRYAKYVPHVDLPRYVALADHQPQVGGAAATGVQA